LNWPKKVAMLQATSLNHAGSGCGKDLSPRLVHELAPATRRAIPKIRLRQPFRLSLVESELFGHERGAFTGAVERKLAL